ncbi:MULTISPECIES: 4-oxalocrotonate tautomerase [Paraburkholderia]|nr:MULTISPECIES: 4-oxalocrotonate tautomerase [Paraburkholderia]MBK3820040.1 4-oxalocrotonate tautomerase [Paraburkholderia aspalathi]MBK3831892.1 4-oxalocrotonate tautomerase [Paraburkholderia aspalathi]MBK3844413.1 4-oxalocrotonate tautomerase [Paraburkholderia aspalathi]MBK3861599.1 4-oxalocrotonate tautomerase [Paraburkholderia aspalathi]MCX4157180.1 4-oxalocrotonate tautomerase [Paraburkholderia aspalathi]
MPSQHAQPINCTTAVRLKARWNGLRCYASSIGSIAHTAIEFTSQHHSSRSHAMPTFRIELFEGRSLEQKRQFVEAITKATCESLGVEPNSVDIILTDVKRENWATGGRLWSEPDA